MTQDNVNSPRHYFGEKYQCIDIIEDFKLDFCLGNAVKYVLRAGRKSESMEEDLKKAIWYLNRKLESL